MLEMSGTYPSKENSVLNETFPGELLSPAKEYSRKFYTYYKMLLTGFNILHEGTNLLWNSLDPFHNISQLHLFNTLIVMDSVFWG